MLVSTDKQAIIYVFTSHVLVCETRMQVIVLVQLGKDSTVFSHLCSSGPLIRAKTKSGLILTPCTDLH